MKIYKFGGASVKDADGVRNLLKVLETVDYNNTVIVVSAMGKTTNLFEKVVKLYLIMIYSCSLNLIKKILLVFQINFSLDLVHN